MAASIQFPPIEELDPARLGLLWSEYRKDYPRSEYHAPLNNVIEKFERRSSPGIEFSFESKAPVPRLWFLNEEGTRLLQVQQNRFVLNWRKHDTSEAYPHYSTIREILLREYRRFENFLKREKITAPKPDQAELTYVSHIDAGDPGGGLIPLSRILRLWNEPPEPPLPSPENVTLKSNFIMKAGEKPVGRLGVTLETRFRVADGSAIYSLQLLARGAPASSDVEGVFRFLDEAHGWIVNSFTMITTSEMHSKWERTQ